MTEARGAVDLAVDLLGAGVDVADVVGVAEGAVVVAPVAHLHERLHRSKERHDSCGALTHRYLPCPPCSHRVT